MEKDNNVKKKSPVICNMSGIYELMYPVEAKVNMTDITGTNCYCDEEAADRIKNRLFAQKDMAAGFGIRLLDSGNYHYLSCFFMEKIEEPFSLVLIDNHTDMQSPGFGRILSCGGWVRYAMEELPGLKRVFLIGMSREHLLETGQLPENVSFIDHREGVIIPGDLPVYLSIDKDALGYEYASTDWDQGDMTEAELLEITDYIMRTHRVLGVDICGEKKDAFSEDDIKRNSTINSKLLDTLCR